METRNTGENGEPDFTKSAQGIHDKDQIIEEPDEAKVSRPVLKPSGGGDPTA